jgi:hypothetical protein
MSVTFGKFYKILEATNTSFRDEDDQDGPLLNSGEYSQAMDAIRSGMHLRKEDCGDFWDDFIQVCANADAMSELLGVPREKVTSWAGKIRELIEQVSKKDDTEAAEDKKNSKLVPTGNDPEMSADPFGNNGVNQPDLNPLPS